MTDENKEELNEKVEPTAETAKKKCCLKFKEIADSKEVYDLLFITFGSFLGALLALCFYHTFAQPKYPPAPFIQPPCQMMQFERGQFRGHGGFYEDFYKKKFHKRDFKKQNFNEQKEERHPDNNKAHGEAPFARANKN